MSDRASICTAPPSAAPALCSTCLLVGGQPRLPKKAWPTSAPSFSPDGSGILRAATDSQGGQTAREFSVASERVLVAWVGGCAPVTVICTRMGRKQNAAQDYTRSHTRSLYEAQPGRLKLHVMSNFG